MLTVACMGTAAANNAPTFWLLLAIGFCRRGEIPFSRAACDNDGGIERLRELGIWETETMAGTLI